MVYQAAYVAALALPGSERQRRNRAKALAAKAKENAQKHAPAGIAVLVNGLFLFFIGTIKLRQDHQRDRDAITATIDTEGFFAKPVQPEPPSGGGGGGGASIDAALAQVKPVPSTAVIPQEAFNAITTVAPMNFEVPTSASSISDLAAKAAAAKPAGGTGGGQGGGNGTGIGTGNGSGQGTGTGSGTGSGVGNAQGAGIGNGTGEINGSITTVIVDDSPSMDKQALRREKILKSLRRAKATFTKNNKRSLQSYGEFEEFEKSTLAALAKGQKVIVWVGDFIDEWPGYAGPHYDRTENSIPSRKDVAERVEEVYARIENAMHEAGATLHIISVNAGPVPPLRAAIIRLKGSFTVDNKLFSYPNYDGDNLMYFKPYGMSAEFRVVGPIGPRPEKKPSFTKPSFTPDMSGLNLPEEMKLFP